MIDADQVSSRTLQNAQLLSLTKHLRHITNALARHSRHLQDNNQITIPQLLCLWELNERGPLSIRELGPLLELNNSTMTGIVDRLESRGLVERQRTDRDRRLVVVGMTAAGENYLQSAPPLISPEIINGLDEMEEPEVRRILHSVEELASMFHDRL